MRKKYYECYSYNLMQFLLENGQMPFSVTVHNKTKKTIWLFNINEKLSSSLKEWTKRGKERTCSVAN